MLCADRVADKVCLWVPLEGLMRALKLLMKVDRGYKICLCVHQTTPQNTIREAKKQAKCFCGGYK